jgi:hypothetical protein
MIRNLNISDIVNINLLKTSPGVNTNKTRSFLRDIFSYFKEMPTTSVLTWQILR